MVEVHKAKKRKYDDNIMIFYATVKGSSFEIAKDIGKQLKSHSKYNLDPIIKNLNEVDPDELDEVRKAIFIISTWEDGSYPPSCANFF